MASIHVDPNVLAEQAQAICLTDKESEACEKWFASRHLTPVNRVIYALYFHLEPGDIRLFCLHAGAFEDPLCGRLEVHGHARRHRTKSCPAYDALSYTWGDSNVCKEVRLDNDHTLPVTINLHNALRRLRQPDQDRMLWVDAICINQSDRVERAEQVGGMASIFRNAKSVRIWLGESSLPFPDRDALLVAEAAWRLEPSDPETFDHSVTPRARYDAAVQAYCADALQNTKPSWWKRAWIVQEYISASSMPVFHCGAHQFIFLDYTLQSFRADTYTTQGKVFAEFFVAVADLHRLKYNVMRQDSSESCVSLMDLHDTMCRAQATDPRDKVYSMLGLLGTSFAEHVPVHYSSSIERVYAQAMWAQILVDETLAALYLAPPVHERTDRASWHMKLDHGRSDGSRCCILQLHARVLSTHSTPSLAKSLLGGNRWRMSDCCRFLTVTGHKKTRVERIIQFSADAIQSSSHTSLRPASELREELYNGFLEGKHTTLHLGKLVHTHLRAWNSIEAEDAPDLEEDDNSFNYMEMDSWITFLMQPAIGELCQFSDEQPLAQLMLTTEGYTGLCRSTVRVGDEVVFLDTLQAPVVLRKTKQGRHKFHGFAYVQDLEVESATGPVEPITLC